MILVQIEQKNKDAREMSIRAVYSIAGRSGINDRSLFMLSAVGVVHATDMHRLRDTTITTRRTN